VVLSKFSLKGLPYNPSHHLGSPGNQAAGYYWPAQNSQVGGGRGVGLGGPGADCNTLEGPLINLSLLLPVENICFSAPVICYLLYFLVCASGTSV
jgi:hypothetical protein